jgi:uncharacterized protein YndB with AHSA1/START domain
MSTATAPVTSLHSLTLVRTLNASRERVFAAWTDPAQIAQWFAPASGFTTTATNDLRRGGSYTISMHNPNGVRHAATGKYLEIVPPERLVFTWSSQENPAIATDTLVTVLLRDLGGKTELTLVHTQLPTAESAQRHEAGWTGCLNSFQLYFDPNAQVEQSQPLACS